MVCRTPRLASAKIRDLSLNATAQWEAVSGPSVHPGPVTFGAGSRVANRFPIIPCVTWLESQGHGYGVPRAIGFPSRARSAAESTFHPLSLCFPGLARI